MSGSSKTPTTPLTGARESSAGDDFHLLWAARKALKLLAPNAQLKALNVEGPIADESQELDPVGEKLLAIDLSEYYGGNSFVTASEVVFSQLKYSTRQTTKTWTAARLSEATNKKKDNSIIQRLADTFATYYQQHGRDDVLRKTRVKLVSNRPASENIKKALLKAAQFLSARPKRVQAKSLLDNLGTTDRAEINRLYDASRLGSYAFTDLLRVFDVSDCGEDSRFGQATSLVEALGKFGGSDVSSQYRDLKIMLLDRMMPEAADAPPMIREDLLPIFKLSSYVSVFPAPPFFEEPKRILPRSESEDLARLIVQTEGKPVCLHADAGRGKTTLLQLLEHELPPGSIMVRFDCYGKGTYLDPATGRHSHRHAMMQISNELAALSGGSLLLSIPAHTDDLLKEFVGRLEMAHLLASSVNNDALIVIAIDAGDNSVHAAKQRGDTSFVPDVLQQPMPKGVRVLVTCRSENIDDLGMDEYEDFLLKGFSETESSHNLKMHIPPANDEQCREFHELTDGIPRLQRYLLDSGGTNVEEMLESLRPDGSTLESVFKQIIRNASRRAGIPEKVDDICKGLIALQRPVPVDFLAKLTNTKSSTVEGFCVDVGFGLDLASDNTISLRDQDFEDFLRVRAGDDASMGGRVADLLFEERNNERYAAIHLHVALGTTGKYAALRDVIIEEDLPSVVSDPVERQEIVLSRISAALKAGATSGDRVGLMKLVWIAAETSKADQAVKSLIDDFPELTEKFGDPLTIQRLHQSEVRSDWPVPDLYKKAKMLSRDETRKRQASEHLREARSWLNMRAKAVKEDEHSYHEFPILNTDIAAATEAIIRIAGIERGIDWLSSWSPPSVIYDCTRLIVSSFLEFGGPESLEEIASKIPLRPDLCLAVIQACNDANVQIPFDLITYSARVWYRFAKMGKKVEDYLLAPGIALCEKAAKDSELRAYLPDVLGLFMPPRPKHAPHMYGENDGGVDLFLRAFLLSEKLKGNSPSWEAVLPDELTPKEKEHHSDRRDFSDIYGILWSAYSLKAEAILESVQEDAAKERFDKKLEGTYRGYQVFSRHDAGSIYRLLANTLADVAISVSSSPSEWLQKVEKELVGQHQVNKISLWRNLAKKALVREDCHSVAIVFLGKIKTELEENPSSARENIDCLVSCCGIANAIDGDVAQQYFRLAIEAAEGVDEEAMTQLQCLSSLSKKAVAETNFRSPELAYKFARFAEECDFRLSGWEGFPWEGVMEGVTCLDPSTGFAISSRWDCRGKKYLDDEIYTVLGTASSQGFIPAKLAYPMGVLAQCHDARHPVFAISQLKQFIEENHGTSPEPLLLMISRDIQLHSVLDDRKRRASEIVEWAIENKFPESLAVQSLKGLCSFLQAEASDEDTPPKLSSQGQKGNKKEPDWDKIIALGPFTTAEKIELAINRVDDLDSFSRLVTKELFSRIQKNAHPKDFVAHLDALLGVNPRVLSRLHVARFIEEALAKWNDHPKVVEWRTKKAEKFLKAIFPELIIGDLFYRDYFEIYRKSFQIDCRDVFDNILTVLPDWIGIAAKATYQIVDEMSCSLLPVEAQQFLDWTLNKVQVDIKENRTDGPWRDGLKPPANYVETLTGFFWALLGHPDKRIRWRAAHAIRRMVKLGCTEILDGLVERIEGRDCPHFTRQNQRFFYLSAKLWLLRIIHRLAKEAPEAVRTHARVIFNCAVNPTVPHALIRHYAKLVALDLDDYDTSLFTEEEISALAKVNNSPFEQVEVDHSEINRAWPEKPENSRIRIDCTDTQPYWFNPLERRFAPPKQRVSEIAEKWICDQWGMTQKELDDDRRGGRTNYSYELTSNRHGSEPTIETLQSYAEWHAMFCAATELLESSPLEKDTWADDPFEDWLLEEFPVWADWWLSDMRDPTPLDEQFWSMEWPVDDDWRKNIEEELFDLNVNIHESNHPGFAVFNSYIRRANQGNAETISIDSALVSKETAQALLRALQTAENPRDYCVPLFEGEYQIDFSHFSLKGWLKSVGESRSGPDMIDPLRNDYSGSLIVPGKDFMQWAALEASPDRKLHWVKGRERLPVTRFECWDDMRGEEKYIGFYSNGYRLWADTGKLLEYLNAKDRCLIVECKIDRYQEKKDYDPGKAKLYLIHPDGTVETIRERYLLGKAPG